jgi:hypothetical protein
MHSNTYNFRPEDSVLDRCYCVTVTDSKVSMRAMKTWCWDLGLGLIWSEIMDTTDVGYNYYSVAVFYFESDTDATMFRLRWL